MNADTNDNYNISVSGPPNAPEGPVEVTNIDMDRATLTWKPPTEDGGAPIKAYSVERREQGRSSWTKLQTKDKMSLTYQATDLESGKEYYFRFFAQNDVGTSKPYEMEEPVIPKSPFGMFQHVKAWNVFQFRTFLKFVLSLYSIIGIFERLLSMNLTSLLICFHPSQWIMLIIVGGSSVLVRKVVHYDRKMINQKH